MSVRYRHRAGLCERRIGSAVFLAHRGRATVCRLNETGSALWRLLKTPLSARDATEVFQQAFPSTSAAEVRRRVRDLLDTLLEDDLLERTKPERATRSRRLRRLPATSKRAP